MTDLDLGFAATWFYPSAIYDQDRAPLRWVFSDMDMRCDAILNAAFADDSSYVEPTSISEYRHSGEFRIPLVPGAVGWSPKYFPDDAASLGLQMAKHLMVMQAMDRRKDSLIAFIETMARPVPDSEIQAVLDAGEVILYPSQYVLFTDWLVKAEPTYAENPARRSDLFAAWIDDASTTNPGWARDVGSRGFPLYALGSDHVARLRSVLMGLPG